MHLTCYSGSNKFLNKIKQSLSIVQKHPQNHENEAEQTEKKNLRVSEMGTGFCFLSNPFSRSTKNVHFAFVF